MKRRKFLQLLGLAPAIPLIAKFPPPKEVPEYEFADCYSGIAGTGAPEFNIPDQVIETVPLPDDLNERHTIGFLLGKNAMANAKIERINFQ